MIEMSHRKEFLIKAVEVYLITLMLIFFLGCKFQILEGYIKWDNSMFNYISANISNYMFACILIVIKCNKMEKKL